VAIRYSSSSSSSSSAKRPQGLIRIKRRARAHTTPDGVIEWHSWRRDLRFCGRRRNCKHRVGNNSSFVGSFRESSAVVDANDGLIGKVIVKMKVRCCCCVYRFFSNSAQSRDSVFIWQDLLDYETKGYTDLSLNPSRFSLSSHTNSNEQETHDNRRSSTCGTLASSWTSTITTTTAAAPTAMRIVLLAVVTANIMVREM
jgi:hypothetical protein